jgi:hypothetical protein
LALARETATPYAIATNLLALALTLAPDDPHRARALLDEALESAATLGYENADELMFVVIAAARLDAWPTALRAVSRALHHQLRSGGYAPLNVAGFLNLAARGLAEHRPEPAATLQGAASAQVHPLVAPVAAATENGVAPPPDLPGGVFVTGARRDATQILVATVGEARLRELRTQGEAMNEDQAYTYARTHIDEYLATLDG